MTEALQRLIAPQGLRMSYDANWLPLQSARVEPTLSGAPVNLRE